MSAKFSLMKFRFFFLRFAVEMRRGKFNYPCHVIAIHSPNANTKTKLNEGRKWKNYLVMVIKNTFARRLAIEWRWKSCSSINRKRKEIVEIRANIFDDFLANIWPFSLPFLSTKLEFFELFIWKVENALEMIKFKSATG